MVELTLTNLISFGLIFFVGLPHGSFDGAVASLVGFKTKFQFLKFLFYYIFLFILVIIFWLRFPITSLLIFLFMTILHFGLSDWSFFRIKKFKYIVSFTYGMSVIFGIIYFNEDQSFIIFEYLTNLNIYFFQKYLFFPYILTSVLILYFMYLSIYEKKFRLGVIEILTLLFIFSLFDPLLAFAIYFCFFHTFKHLYHLIININSYLPNKKFVIYSTLIFTFISWVAALVFVFYLFQNYSLYESIIKVIFIGLAALTLPHMILVDFIYRKNYQNI